MMLKAVHKKDSDVVINVQSTQMHGTAISENIDQMRIEANSKATSTQERQETVDDGLTKDEQSKIKSGSRVPNIPDAPCERQTGTGNKRLQSSSNPKACEEVYDAQG